MPASSLWFKRWQALKSASVALATPRCWRARATQLLRVSASVSPALPLTPCITSDHFRRWTSMSNVCNAKAVATFSTWDAKAGRLVWEMSSRRWLLKLIAASTSCTLSYTVVSFVSCLSILERRSPNSSFRTDLISSLIDFFTSSRIVNLMSEISSWRRDRMEFRNSSRSLFDVEGLSVRLSFVLGGHDCLEQLSGWLRERWNYVLWVMWHDWDPDPKICELEHDYWHDRHGWITKMFITPLALLFQDRLKRDYLIPQPNQPLHKR